MQKVDRSPPHPFPQGFAYPFDYIQPARFPDAMRKLYDGPAAVIPGTGPAPMLMRAEDWKRVRGAGRLVLFCCLVCAARSACKAMCKWLWAVAGYPTPCTYALCRPQVTPDWEKYTAKVEADPELVKTLGWVSAH